MGINYKASTALGPRVNGFDRIPQAFIDLFEGKNEGKMIVKI